MPSDFPAKIVIHHSLTPDSGTVSWGAIRRYHTSPPPDGPPYGPYSDIGYHAGTELVYTEYETFIGRPWDKIGAHTKGQNDKSLGFLFVGNYDLEPPPKRMLEVGAKTIALWMRLFNIPKDKIFRHSDFANYKSCPGVEFDIEELKKWL